MRLPVKAISSRLLPTISLMLYASCPALNSSCPAPLSSTKVTGDKAIVVTKYSWGEVRASGKEAGPQLGLASVWDSSTHAHRKPHLGTKISTRLYKRNHFERELTGFVPLGTHIESS